MPPEVPDVRTLSRQELYDQVWSVPASRLASEFGISDVGLSKICRRHDVPRPPRGYWAKLEHGKSVERPPLPKLNDEDLNEIRIFRNAFFSERESAGTESVSRPAIVVPDVLDEPHDLIVTARRALKSATQREDKSLQVDTSTCLNIRVTRNCLDRSLRILDAVIKQWERMGGTVSIGGTDYNRNHVTHFGLHGDRLAVQLCEVIDRTPVDGNKSRHWMWQKWKYIPTGRLSLQIDGYADRRRRRWSDGKRQQLEAMLDSFLDGLVDILEYERLRRLDNECEGRQRALLKEIREAAKKRDELEEQRRTSIAEAAASWRQASEIRSYLAAFRGKIEAKELFPRNPEKFAEWMEWATWYADHLDPLTPGPDRPRFVEPPKNMPIGQLDLTRRTRAVVTELGVCDANELHELSKEQVRERVNDLPYGAWDEICRVLEGLGYDVSGRYNAWYGS